MVTSQGEHPRPLPRPNRQCGSAPGVHVALGKAYINLVNDNTNKT